MPSIVIGESRTDVRKERSAAVKDVSYDYDYPEGLDLKPGSHFHDKLVAKIWQRAKDSHTYLSRRFTSWNRVDETLTAYIDVTDSEKDLQDSDPLKPVSIVFPNSYAILETLLSYMVTAFFQDPIFRYVGNGPEHTVGAILMEKIIQQHCEYNAVPLNLHTMFRDNFAYGVGATVPTWKVKHGMKPSVQDVVTQSGLFGLGRKTGQEIIFERGVIHEGNALENIDPYLMLPDPNVSISQIQDGEFFGWINRTNLMDLLSEELDDDDMFNVRYLKHLRTSETTVSNSDNSSRGTKTSTQANPNVTDPYNNKVDEINMYIKLIPSEWDLGDAEYPETWMFTLAGDTIITKARPAGHLHGDFAVAACASEFDGYSSSPISRLEMLDGLQGILNWLFNSHIANVRKSLNDMFVVDPYLVNINDLKDPKPGKLIRMRRVAWGRGVQHAVQQLAVNDVTRGNMADSGMISQFMQALSGTDNPMMGNLRSGGPERLTSAEFQGTMSGAVNRLERVARVTGYQALQPIARMFASNVQQLMEQDTYVRTVGSWPEVIRREYGVTDEQIPVTPYDLIIDYDLRMRDGSVPGGNFSQAWIQLFQVLAGNERLMQRFDMAQIFKHIALNLGAKNVENFERTVANAPGAIAPNVRTAPDEEVAQQAQAGNLIPIER